MSKQMPQGVSQNLTLNTIAARNGMIVVPQSERLTVITDDQAHEQVVASFQAELMNLGFMLDRDSYRALQHTLSRYVVALYNEVIPDLKARVGDNRNYRPMYPNFPAQVMEMSTLQLYLNAIFHYWSNGQWEPKTAEKARELVYENTDFKIIKLGTDEDFNALFTRMVTVNTSLTQDDKDIIAWFVQNRRHQIKLPGFIPFKETLCQLAGEGLDVPVHSPTDVLRIAVYLSGGDISLPGVPKVTMKEPGAGRRRYQLASIRSTQIEAREKFKFKKFNRSQRRFLLGLLEKTKPTVEHLSGKEVTGGVADMQVRRSRWLRLGEILHPGEYATTYPLTAAAFDALRKQPADFRVRTFASLVDSAFSKSLDDGIEVLSTRPGEYARRLDWMLRTHNPLPVLRTFHEVGPAVSSKVLFELWNHFDNRTRKDAPRAIIIKGARAKTKTLPSLPPMPADLVGHVKDTIMGIIEQGFSTLPPLGATWIDPRLKKVPVPFSMRSVNSSIKTYVRGTRIPFQPDAKTIRGFVHWFDEDGSQDLDLSVGLYRKDLAMLTDIGFTNLRSESLGCCHSGDIRHRKGACAEYVDIPIQQALAGGARYAMFQVYNFNGGSMYSVTDTVFGVMEREKPEANKIFVPASISNCAKLANEGNCVIAAIIDLKEREYIWADLETSRGLPMLEQAVNKTNDVIRMLVNGGKMSVYDLLSSHAKVRGTIVDDPEKAATIMKWEDFVTDYVRVAEYINFGEANR